MDLVAQNLQLTPMFQIIMPHLLPIEITQKPSSMELKRCTLTSTKSKRKLLRFRPKKLQKDKTLQTKTLLLPYQTIQLQFKLISPISKQTSKLASKLLTNIN